jgi:hypothetical protein
VCSAGIDASALGMFSGYFFSSQSPDVRFCCVCFYALLVSCLSFLSVLIRWKLAAANPLEPRRRKSVAKPAIANLMAAPQIRWNLAAANPLQSMLVQNVFSLSLLSFLFSL